ncbi:hypothetical protein [Lignipirellula cremea]|uniref:Uncharacterized protein n=1 Tax=Lignipirellula cremea TaxID=2528010 RepID=A0A518DYI2_9BACT|nr:hypothetical protein [Lignipirellula cremea]QDU96855.1 hypothetical protein Pla8534_46770 [Lignipirellula cremea]
MNVLVLTLALLAPTDPGNDLARAIVEAGHKKVGVVPMVLHRQGFDESSVGSLGPRSRTMAKAVYQKLIAASREGRYKGQFSVVPERTLMASFKKRNFTIDDLGDPDKLRMLADDCDCDGLTVLTRMEDEETDIRLEKAGKFADNQGGNGFNDGQNAEGFNGGQNNDRWQDDGGRTDSILVEGGLTDTQGGIANWSQTFEEALTLGKAAYMGDSFEVRRWIDGRLQNVGIDIDGDRAFGAGPNWEREHYVHMSARLPHPYAVRDFPYEIQIRANGQIRDGVPVEDKFVTELNPGENYSIRVRNNSDEDVYMALFVDGVCTLEKELLEPDQLTLGHHWYLPAHSEWHEIKGWFNIKRDYQTGRPTGQAFLNNFQIVDRQDSVAYGQGFEDNVGMITAIFYSTGYEGIPDPGVAPRALPAGLFGTGSGLEEETVIQKWGNKPRGLLLSAMTLYYRSHEELVGLQGGQNQTDFNFSRKDFVNTGNDPLQSQSGPQGQQRPDDRFNDQQRPDDRFNDQQRPDDRFNDQQRPNDRFNDQQRQDDQQRPNDRFNDQQRQDDQQRPDNRFNDQQRQDDQQRPDNRFNDQQRQDGAFEERERQFRD